MSMAVSIDPCDGGAALPESPRLADRLPARVRRRGSSAVSSAAVARRSPVSRRATSSIVWSAAGPSAASFGLPIADSPGKRLARPRDRGYHPPLARQGARASVNGTAHSLQSSALGPRLASPQPSGRPKASCPEEATTSRLGGKSTSWLGSCRRTSGYSPR